MNKSNADHAVLFEALALVISYGNDESEDVKELINKLLARFVAVKGMNTPPSMMLCTA